MYRGINKFKRLVYWPGTHVVKDNKRDFVTNTWHVVNRRKNHFCQLLDKHIVDKVKYIQLSY
jgi:hypothetical protein